MVQRLAGIGDTKKIWLQLQGENYEWTDMYEVLQKQRRKKVSPELAAKFRAVENRETSRGIVL